MKKLILLSIILIVGCDLFEEEETSCVVTSSPNTILCSDVLGLPQSSSECYDDISRDACMLMAKIEFISNPDGTQCEITYKSSFDEQLCVDIGN